MAVFTDLQDVPAFRNAALTIGTFDGVHLGHCSILQEVRRHAAESGGESVLITFEPHPRRVLFPHQPLKLLTPLHQKLSLITAQGIDHVVVAPFSPEFARLSADAYIRDFLVHHFRPHSIVIGYDHRFGHDRSGDIALLRRYETQFHYRTYEIPARLIADAAVSSTKIRNALLAGQVQDAARMLGRPYSLCGRVVRGAQLGRTIGYPTANLQALEPDQLLPATGVYAVQVRHQGLWHPAMLNIGYRPTVDGNSTQLHIEAHLFDFMGDLYDASLELSFVARLRDEQRFDGLDALKAQLYRDEQQARSLLG